MSKDIEDSPTTHPKGPAKLTVYPASIVKDHGANDTGIFFPEKYVPSGTVDLLVYFHGLPTPCGGHDSDKIWDSWRSSTFLMREWVNKSSKNVILVAPRLRGDKGGLRLDMAADDFLTRRSRIHRQSRPDFTQRYAESRRATQRRQEEKKRIPSPAPSVSAFSLRGSARLCVPLRETLRPPGCAHGAAILRRKTLLGRHDEELLIRRASL